MMSEFKNRKLLFSYKEAKISYKKAGQGNKILLAFHGYGQDKNTFDVLEENFGEIYTIYSFDLFFHGESEWLKKDNPVSKDFLEKAFRSFFNNHNITWFSVLGFSMGGKYAILLLELFYKSIDKLILIAPDGIKTPFIYNLTTYPVFFKNIFRYLINYPQFFFYIISLLKKLNLIDKSLSKFVDFQMNTRTKRLKVYYSWMLLRSLKFNINTIAKIINKYNIKTTIVLGKYDKIITYKYIRKFINKIENNLLTLHILESGHNHLIETYNEETIKSQIRKPLN